MKKLLIRTFTLLFVVASAGTYFVYQQLFSSLITEDKLVFIPSGSTYHQVKDSLRVNGLLDNEFVFDMVCSKKNYVKIHPGRYMFTSGSDLNGSINILRLGQQEPMSIIFNNVSTIQALAGKISKQIESDSLSLLNAFTNVEFYEKYSYNEASVRKLFIPNTYEVYWTISPSEFLSRMQKEFGKFWTYDRLELAKSKGLTPHEVSVLASIVQKESSKIEEQPIIAGLYMNRLNQNMKLQSDPTVIYTLNERDGFDSKIKRVLKKDLSIDSPYNTYKYKGLPPNPICIPEMSALNSVLNATAHEFIYMCAKDDFSGYHNFTKSWIQHKKNANAFQRALTRKGVMR